MVSSRNDHEISTIAIPAASFNFCSKIHIQWISVVQTRPQPKIQVVVILPRGLQDRRDEAGRVSEYLGFRLCNLIIPGEPLALDLATPSGIWELKQKSNYAASKQAIEEGRVAETYSISTVVPIGASVDFAFEELLPICLAATYLTGMSVATTRAHPHSFVSFLQVGPHFPRPRAVTGVTPVVTNETEFQDRIEAFVRTYPTTSQTEKSRILVHHMLDGLACWSMEDLCLSTATLLEIIAATAKAVAAAAGMRKTKFADRIDYAAQRFGLPFVSTDFRNMRNDLVHEGTLSGTGFVNKTAADCAIAAAAALEWIDMYMHSALGLGPVGVNRFPPNTYKGLNAFSLD
jgi:hypothetical protein